MQKANKVKTKTIILGNNNTVVNVNTTAMHVVNAVYNVYCTQLRDSNFINEYCTDDSADFAHYNVWDMQDKITAYFSAFSALHYAMQNDSTITLQQAFNIMHDNSNAQQYDTIVAEEITEILNSAIMFAYNDKNIASNVAEEAAYS